jgi:hypothetical protein
VSVATELCARARADLTECEQEFAEAAAAGDLDRAGKVIGESVQIAEALARQERMLADGQGRDFSGGPAGGCP